MAWLTPNRLVTLVADHLPTLVDPAAGRTLRQLPGNACEGYASTPTASTPKALVWFTRTRLVTGDASGRLRSASTPGIGSTCEGKGVAADRRGRRAWIAGPSGVVEVDLQTMRVTARVRGSVPRGSRRVSVVWTARHQVTVAHLTAGFRPAGVELVDTEAHTRRIIDSAGGGVRYAQGRLLVFDGGDGVQRSPAHRGLRVYDTRGRLRYRRLRGKHVWNVQVRGGRAWLLGSTGVTVMDVRSGKVLSRWAGRAPDDLTFLTPPL
jgi:hypothetical protein